jgi:hypothetical protein
MPCSRAPEVYNLVHFCFDEKNVSRHSQSIDYEEDVPWRAVQSSAYMVEYIFRSCNSTVRSPYTFNSKTVTQSSSTLYGSIVFLEFHLCAHFVPTQRLFKISILWQYGLGPKGLKLKTCCQSVWNYCKSLRNSWLQRATCFDGDLGWLRMNSVVHHGLY